MFLHVLKYVNTLYKILNIFTRRRFPLINLFIGYLILGMLRVLFTSLNVFFNVTFLYIHMYNRMFSQLSLNYLKRAVFAYLVSKSTYFNTCFCTEKYIFKKTCSIMKFRNIQIVVLEVHGVSILPDGR